MRGYRKIFVFLISLVVITILLFNDKDVSGIVTLFGIFCGANVGAKFTFKNEKKLD